MQTFESQYKEKLKTQLAQFIPDKAITVSNDISYEPLEYDSNALVAIIRTGAGLTSGKSEYDLITVTFNISLITASNDLQKVLGALTSLIWNYQGKWDNVSIKIYNVASQSLEDKTYIFKPVFTTPVVIGGEQEVKIEGETLEVSNVIMSVTVGYSSNADMVPDSFDLEIDGTKYPINAIRYDHSSVPAYDVCLPESAEFVKHTFLNNVISFNFTMLKSLPGVDSLQDILSGEFFGANRLSGKTLRLWRGDVVANIQTYQLTEVFENGSKIINLVLSR
jgi:hypothetical protein